LVEIEQAFKELKNDLSIRPIHHQSDARIEAHIFVAFLAYCLMVTLKQRLKALASGLTPRAVLEKLGAIQMIDVELPRQTAARSSYRAIPSRKMISGSCCSA
jgi:transposase